MKIILVLISLLSLNALAQPEYDPNNDPNIETRLDQIAPVPRLDDLYSRDDSRPTYASCRYINNRNQVFSGAARTYRVACQQARAKCQKRSRAAKSCRVYNGWF